jgi:hypothetical protein
MAAASRRATTASTTAGVTTYESRRRRSSEFRSIAAAELASAGGAVSTNPTRGRAWEALPGRASRGSGAIADRVQTGADSPLLTNVVNMPTFLFIPKQKAHRGERP